MVLSDNDIRKALQAGDIVLEPCPPLERIRGASLDLCLGNSFRLLSRQDTSHIDLWLSRDELRKTIDRVMGEEIVLEHDNAFYLHPGELALGVTQESVTLPADMCGLLNGRSSLARLGLMVHATAHVIDPGWSGRIVLEFFNCGRLPLGLKPGMAICALMFARLSSAAVHPYSARADAKYRNQKGAVASLLAMER